jgi:hypothetical protein
MSVLLRVVRQEGVATAVRATAAAVVALHHLDLAGNAGESAHRLRRCQPGRSGGGGCQSLRQHQTRNGCRCTLSECLASFVQCLLRPDVVP